MLLRETAGCLQTVACKLGSSLEVEGVIPFIPLSAVTICTGEVQRGAGACSWRSARSSLPALPFASSVGIRSGNCDNLKPHAPQPSKCSPSSNTTYPSSCFCTPSNVLGGGSQLPLSTAHPLREKRNIPAAWPS